MLCEGSSGDMGVCDGGCGGVWAAGAMGVVCAVPRVMKGMYCTVLYCTEVAGSHLRVVVVVDSN